MGAAQLAIVEPTPANDDLPPDRTIDRWWLLINGLKRAGAPSLAVHAMQSKLKGWDVDRWIETFRWIAEEHWGLT